MWGGSHLYVESQFPAAISAFVNLGVNAARDVDAAQILSFAYAQGMKLASAELEYAKPVADAPIFSEYLAIPAVQDTSGIRSLANLTVALNDTSPNGLRESYWTATLKLDEELATFVKDVFFEEVRPIVDVVTIAAISLQVITVPQLERMARKGGNALGLSAADGPLLLVQPNTMWNDSAHDERVMNSSRNVIERSVAEAKRRGLYAEYIYMNYASQFQDVVASYGKENQERLKRVARKYDPTGVFQRLVPGYFKLE
jgi:hypothetical protein